MSRKVFINLPVKDLQATIRFFTALGFKFDQRFTNENATCMIISEHAYVMLLVQSFFQGFVKDKQLCDASTHSEVIVALDSASRAECDELVQKAFAAGAKKTTDPIDHGFMYQRAFQDLDGHIWEVFHMDLNAIPPQPAS